MSTPAAETDTVVYPESDGKPRADNTLRWDWMVKIVGELREVFAGREVFVAGDLFWYPVKGDPGTVTAPDALVAFGRPPGYRGSYKQWEEGGVAPQVVFEVLSPSNTREEMDAKRRWYDRHGVEEYYFIDPYGDQLLGWVRQEGKLEPVYPMKGFVSPRLGVRFDVNGEVRLFAPDGREFRTREERVEEIQAELHKTAVAFER
ncbi:Uma2 family endonuclease [Gemmata sp.]|uniref:Uma2 family endonuclease n=1 Tax=Gemmata sp. TaxID=1914242 RepID=UPI003F6F190A